MRGVEISSLDLDVDGGITIKGLAAVFEDGEVTGASYLASSLRKSVEARGPVALDSVVRLFNNGYYGASWIDKGRVYLKEGQQAPTGYAVQEGPRGGRYYETTRGRGRPKRKWEIGERIKINSPWTMTHRMKGTIVRFEVSGADRSNDPDDIAVVDVDMPDGTVNRYFIKLNMLVPPDAKVSKRSREQIRMESMGRARDAVKDTIEARLQDFRTARFDHNEPWYVAVSPYENLRYAMTIDKTDDGIEIWSPIEGQDLDVHDAPALDDVLKSLSYMPPKAIRDLKRHVQRIVLSPIRNPDDGKMSRITGSNFVSAATMNMKTRELVMYPRARTSTPQGMASILTHETGHAADAFRESIVDAYNKKLRTFWDSMEEQGISMPVDTGRTRAIEAEHGVPTHPNDWMDGYGKWRDFDLGTRNPDIKRFWGWYPRSRRDRQRTGLDGLMIGEKSWNELSPVEQTTIYRSARRGEPVSDYARTNEKEYYAEAYEHYRFGSLPKNHVMYDHFRSMEDIWRWLTTP